MLEGHELPFTISTWLLLLMDARAVRPEVRCREEGHIEPGLPEMGSRWPITYLTEVGKLQEERTHVSPFTILSPPSICAPLSH